MPNYARVMNLDKKEVLSWMSPFEVYYGRKNNIRTLHLSSNTGDASTGSVSDAVPEDLEQNMSKFEQNRRKIRRRASKATERSI